jgi:integrase/recombinase XerD
MNRIFSSPLATAIKGYLQLRLSLGFNIETTVAALTVFDRYLVERFPEATTVTAQIVVDYLETTNPLQSCTRHNRLSQLRQFCRFLFQLNPETYIPAAQLLPAKRVTRTPHLYTLEQVTGLIQLANGLRPVGSIRPSTYATLLGLLWVTGLRIGEALRLNLQDVDYEHGLLHIQQTKNYKSRLVPLNTSTVQALGDYCKQRSNHCADHRPTAPFFINNRGRRYSRTPIKRTFSQLISQLGLKTAQGKAPRLHDFRHSFATRSLTAFYQAGKEPTAYLPVLATFLGHTHITGTQVYLHPSPDLLETAAERFRAHVLDVHQLLPGGNDEEP